MSLNKLKIKMKAGQSVSINCELTCTHNLAVKFDMNLAIHQYITVQVFHTLNFH